MSDACPKCQSTELSLLKRPIKSRITQHLRRQRRGRLGKSWYVDETYIKVKGKWCYLYRAVDRSGALVDC